MPAFKPQQCRLIIDGRAFHFVSYEAEIANPARNKEGVPEMWYLMAGSRRVPTVTCDHRLTAPETERVLTAWAIANAIGDTPAAPAPTAPRYRTLE